MDRELRNHLLAKMERQGKLMRNDGETEEKHVVVQDNSSENTSESEPSLWELGKKYLTGVVSDEENTPKSAVSVTKEHNSNAKYTQEDIVQGGIPHYPTVRFSADNDILTGGIPKNEIPVEDLQTYEDEILTETTPETLPQADLRSKWEETDKVLEEFGLEKTDSEPGYASADDIQEIPTEGVTNNLTSEKTPEVTSAAVPENLPIVDGTLPVSETEKTIQEKYDLPNLPEQSELEEGRLNGELSDENKRKYSKMSGEAKSIFKRAFESLYAVPGVNRLVGHLELGHRNKEIDKHEQMVMELKTRFDVLGQEIKGAQASINSKTEAIQELEASIVKNAGSNVELLKSMQNDLKKIRKEKKVLAEKLKTLSEEQSLMRTEVQFRINLIKHHTAERDAVANMFIEHYQEALEPLEKTINTLKSEMDEEKLAETVMEARHAEAAKRLEEYQQEKTQYESILRKAGHSPEAIANSEGVLKLEAEIKRGNEKIKDAKGNVANRIRNVEEKISGVLIKAEVVNKEVGKYITMKKHRPIEVVLESPAKPVEPKPQAGPEVSSGGAVAPAETVVENKQVTPEVDKRLTTKEFIAGWNAYLNEKHGDSASGALVNKEAFLSKMRQMKMSEEFKTDPVHYKKILESYYRFMQIPADKFSKSIDAFIASKS